MAESHQPPYSLQAPPLQQHPGMAPWYGMPPHLYQAQQVPAPPPQHHSMPWTAPAVPPRPPPGDQTYSYAPQHYHAPPQGDFYPRPQQVHHHFTPPPQHGQPQFTYMYGQQDQVWHQANNSWGYQQWSHPAQTASLSQEEVWAAKARAWAASKAIPDEPRPNSNALQQPHQGYLIQPQEQTTAGGSQLSLQPPGQESASIRSSQDNVISHGQSEQLRGQSEHPPQTLGYNQPFQDKNLLMPPKSAMEPFDQKSLQAGLSHSSDGQSLFASSQIHDATASSGLDTSVSGSQGTEPQFSSKKPPTGSAYPHQATHMLSQSQAPPLMSQPQLPYPEKVSNNEYELQQQQVPSSFLQPPAPQNQQQPPAQVLHQPQKPPLQNHYLASGVLEGVEGEFGLSPVSLQNWAPVGGPGMPFPPAMGAGTAQFDPGHGPHQLPMPWRPDGAGLQGLGFPNSAPFGVGTSPGLGPGSGPTIRPLFAPESFVERPKKAAVPSWLREELLKKKTAGLTGNVSGLPLADDSSRVNGGEPANILGQRIGVSDKLRGSSLGLSGDEEEDQEEEIEAARIVAINQEIKRLLTEVLLKVTGDLFKEIAQEVIDEDSDDTLQGMPSPGEQSRGDKAVIPSSPTDSPVAPSGRVFVSSGRTPVADEDARDEETSDSGGTAGDVLGLGNYASDDEVHDKDYEANPPQENTDTGSHVNSVDHVNNEGKATSDVVDDPSQSSGPFCFVKGNVDGLIAGQTSVKQDTNAYDGRLQSGKSPVKDDLSLTAVQAGKTAGKMLVSEPQIISEQSYLKEASNTMPKEDGKRDDASTRSMPGKNATAHSSLDAPLKRADNKETSFSQNTLPKDRKKDGKREASGIDHASKERRREDKPLTESKSRGEKDDRSKVKSYTSIKERHIDERRKVATEVKRSRGSESRVRDSSREKRKDVEKVKEKSKSRMRESDRDRKQEKKEREGRSRRGEAVEKKARYLSSSPSSSACKEGSSSSSSDRSRGRRLRTGRLTRHHTSVSSPGSSRKRRASRSRSRSRSPHVKHTHRRIVPSPSHEKSRMTGSKSPVHWRGRG